jgi:predicted branched-subunit amino acid permease
LAGTSRLGLDAAVPALFLWVLRGQLKARADVAAALVGGALAAVLVPIAPAGVPVLAAGLAAAVWGACRSPSK